VRFKLRARTYGTDDSSPVFTEIKRKIKTTIVKSRARIPRDRWCAELILNPNRILDISFKSDAEEVAFLEFLRLTREIGASPKVLIRYTREAYISTVDQYARVSLDRDLKYQRTHSWDGWGRDGKWRQIDCSLTQNKSLPFSGVILELKTLSDVPEWIIELVEKFDLVRTGHCKYSNAIWEESLFCGTTDSPIYATDLLVH
jgi:SPX domain protein involved in polyphosphate accumulation